MILRRPLLFALSILVPPVAVHTGGLHGTLLFPPRPKSGDARPLAYWRVENGVLPIAAPPAEPRGDIVVVLEPETPPAPVPLPVPPIPPVPMYARPSRLEPRVAVAVAGAKVQLKNEDSVARTFYLKNGESFMPKEAVAPGATREVRFSVAAEYEISDADSIKGGATLLVVTTPYIGRTDDKGVFNIDAPDGRYLLKAYYKGAWIEPQPIEVGKTKEVSVKLPAEKAPPPAKASAREPLP